MNKDHRKERKHIFNIFSYTYIHLYFYIKNFLPDKKFSNSNGNTNNNNNDSM